jgi:hypothetical protein
MPAIADIKVAPLIAQLEKELADLGYDAKKADMGQKAAQRRVRKAMQRLKTSAQDIRLVFVTKK